MHRTHTTTAGRLAAMTALSTFIAAASLSGCAKDPSKNVAKAKVDEAKKEEPKKEEAKKDEAAEAPKKEEPKKEAAVAPAAATAAAAPAAEGLPLSGQIDFIGSKVTGNHECTFKEWSGSIALKDGKAEGGSLSFTVKTASVVSDYKNPNDWSKKLDGHLKSCDFFCAAKHPEATFVSKSITAKAGDKGATHEITGDLTIRGTTKSVTFPANVAVTPAEVTGKAEFSINRKDFKIEYPGKPDDLIRDDVVLKIDLKGKNG